MRALLVTALLGAFGLALTGLTGCGSDDHDTKYKRETTIRRNDDGTKTTKTEVKVDR